jgi:hypothetical protein
VVNEPERVNGIKPEESSGYTGNEKIAKCSFHVLQTGITEKMIKDP